ncbi:MAG: gamma-glutamyl-gamma-aminobutyrate hydrolase family protein [Pseudomonadales bacterium]|nr:gamma-glutamyl-gamma-aminobutyrate hydrolase family protein [Pseudomonadales bacterium]
MTNDKPLIAVTGPGKGGFVPWIMTRLAIQRAGGKAVRVHTGCYVPDMQFDGLVVGGGSDISPEHYGEELRELAREDNVRSLRQRLTDSLIFLLRILFSIKLRQSRRDPDRDEMEKQLINRAINEHLPVLGICRGEQLINVTLGGTLHQDATEFYTEVPDVQSIRLVKDVDIVAGSRLAQVIDDTELRVNALHNQAVDQLGEALQVCARDRNGIVQAIERTDRHFVIGVQWHPEYLPRQDSHQRLFHALVASAAENSRLIR